MAQHYYPLSGAGESVAGRWAELLELQRAGADVVQQWFKANPSPQMER